MVSGVAGDLSLNSNSNLVVTFDIGYSVVTGDSWTLIDWSGLLATNGFSTGTNLRTGGESALLEGNLDLPDLQLTRGYDGQMWQISNFSGNGALTITIVAMPEPAECCCCWPGWLPWACAGSVPCAGDADVRGPWDSTDVKHGKRAFRLAFRWKTTLHSRRPATRSYGIHYET